MKTSRFKQRMETVISRPLNCDHDLTEKDRCPQCNQYHLRPGYCQALDPINKGKYPGVWGKSE